MYYKTAEKIIASTDAALVSETYDQGFLFGRVGKGYVYQTRSLRINLESFVPNSENRRILAKFSQEHPELLTQDLPIRENYDWQIHKQAKDFYSTKFPSEKFSAVKIKELLTGDYHYNLLLTYKAATQDNIGHVICYQNTDLIHYCYPFYELTKPHNNLGMYMMLQGILWSQLHGKKYFYLGGVTRPEDSYKLQFKGLEWWNNDHWETDLEKLKLIMREFSKY